MNDSDLPQSHGLLFTLIPRSPTFVNSQPNIPIQFQKAFNLIWFEQIFLWKFENIKMCRRNNKNMSHYIKYCREK